MITLNSETGKKEDLNSFLLMFYIFTPTLTLPLNDSFNSGLAVWIFTTIILAVSFHLNYNKLNLRALMVIIIIIAIMLFNYLLMPYKEEALYFLVEFVKFGVIPLFLASNIKREESLLKYWLILGILNLIILLFYINDINQREFNYMTFGRYSTLSFIIFSIYYYRKKFAKLMLPLMILSGTMIIIFGNRSSILVLFLILIYFALRNVVVKPTLKKCFKIHFYIVIIAFLIFNLKKIIYRIIDILENKNIASYTFKKLGALLDNNVQGFVSGRDSIYSNSISMIYENNLMPKGIGYYQYSTGEVYPHNIFLDIILTFGFVGIIFLLILIPLFILSYCKINDRNFREIIAILSIYQFTILNFSGTFWSAPVVWMILGLFLSKGVKKTKRDRSQLFI